MALHFKGKLILWSSVLTSLRKGAWYLRILYLRSIFSADINSKELRGPLKINLRRTVENNTASSACTDMM